LEYWAGEAEAKAKRKIRTIQLVLRPDKSGLRRVVKVKPDLYISCPPKENKPFYPSEFMRVTNNIHLDVPLCLIAEYTIYIEKSMFF